ncbi:MAG: pyridoxal phosphate-dependent decarboxylase family protein [Gaiellales bacterium]
MSSPPGDEASALDLSAEQMRALGYAAVDLMVEHMTGIGRRPAYAPPDPDVLWSVLGGPAPAEGEDPVALLRQAVGAVIGCGIRADHPGMLAYIPNHPTFPGAVADFAASGANVFAGSWQGGPGAAVLELATLGWIRDQLGLDPDAEGVLQSGGSMANLVGLAAARDSHLPGEPDRVAYTSGQAHSSVGRALSLLGVPAATQIELDDGYRLRPDLLDQAASADRAAGRVPWCVIAAAGATSTGAVDDVQELARVCRRHGMWLHVDGAYGGFLALTERGRRLMPSLELADSLVLDAHKSLFVPITAGIVFVRRPGLLERTFAVRPDYLHDAYSLGGTNFSDRGPELTRPFRALKVWLTIRTFGFRRLAAALDRGLDLAELAAEEIERSPRLERITGPWLGVVTFRSSEGLPADRLVQAVAASGRGVISTTVLGGETVARVCVLGHRTSAEDVRAVLSAAAAAA